MIIAAPPPAPAIRVPRRQARRAFSLVEMLATVAALVIVLGLMVSLARYVRREASNRLTRQVLAQLDVLMRQYTTRYTSVPQVPPFAPAPPPREVAAAAAAPASAGAPPVPLLPAIVSTEEVQLPDEATLQQNALANNRALVAVLAVEGRRYPDEFAALPPSVFTDGRLLDAWGTPIVFMPALHPAVGIAMENKPFFLSAGPDRLFRTLENNLYSYEQDLERTAGGGE